MFDAEKPFANNDCYNEFLKVFTELKFKLYGQIKFAVVSKSDLEFDLNGGEMHYTEKDLKKISEDFEELNKKWKTEITFCLFPASKYPMNILVNIRSPKAPFALVAED